MVQKESSLAWNPDGLYCISERFIGDRLYDKADCARALMIGSLLGAVLDRGKVRWSW